MTNRKIDIRHFVLESIEATVFYRPVRGGLDKAKRLQLSQIHQ
jgi:hypothetical protein